MPGGYSWEFLVDLCRPVLQMLTLFFHNRFQTWPLKSIPVFRPGLFFLIHLELKRKMGSYTPVVPSKTIPDSRPKWAKSITVFRPKRRENPTLWDGTYLYGLYKEVSPPETLCHDSILFCKKIKGCQQK